MKIREGEIVGVIGPNGAGKTTLIKQLTGELIPTEGKINIMNFDVIKDPSKIKPYIGVCPQEGGLISHLTVKVHLYYFAMLKGLSKNDAIKNTENILNILDLKSHEKKTIGQLSGGLKRRVFVGIALINEPSIIFLDESTTGLDPVSRIDFWKFIERIREEKPETTIIITTHYLEELDRVSNRLIFINKGKVVLDGNVKEVRSLIFDYDIKITLPERFKDALAKELSMNGLNFKINESFGRINLLLSKRDISKAMEIITKHTSDIVVESPTLDEVFLGVMKNE